MKIEDALLILEFDDVKVIPKLKDIQRQFHKLSKIQNPDKNGGTQEATEDFQLLLNAYHLAGKLQKR
jgi:curved DNA-binding protein CbpA